MLPIPGTRPLVAALILNLAVPVQLWALEPPLAGSTRGEAADWLDLLQFIDSDDKRFEFERGGDQVGVTLVGNAHVRTAQFRLWADGIGVSRITHAADAEPSYRLVAVGNVLLLHGGQSFRAETLLYDHGRQRAVMTGVRLRVDVEFLQRPPGFAGEFSGDARDRQAALLDGSTESPESPDQAPGGHRAGSDLGTMPASGPPGRGRLGPTGRLVAAARLLEVEEFARFVGDGIQVTTCDFGHPHWAIEADRFRIDRVVLPPESAETETAESVHYEAELSSTRLRVDDWTIPFLPSLSWDTRWNDSTPLRSVSYSNSSNFGQRVDTLWRGDLLLPRAARSWVDLGLRLDYLSRRGTGYGAEARWGVRPSRWSRDPGAGRALWGIDVYGVGTYYGIHDRGEDANDLIPEHRERNRVRVHQRARLPWGTLIDAEYAVERDANFLEEYFESELRGEKVPENLIYVRQPISELAALTALAKVQKVPFRREVERTPELSFFWVEQPIGETGIDIDVDARGADLRFQPANTEALASRRLYRSDVRATVARSVGSTRWMKVRPFFETRYTLWEEDELRRNPIERVALATGGVARWHLSRTFASGWGPYDALRHTVDPEVRYRILFENNVDSAEVFRFDGTEDVRRLETFTFSLRSFLFGRRPGALVVRPDSTEEPDAEESDDPATGTRAELDPVGLGDLDDLAERGRLRGARAPTATHVQHRLIEGEVSIDYFPDPRRDNAGDEWGPARAELLLEPVPWLGYFMDARYDFVGDSRFEQFDHGLQVRYGAAAASVGTRYRRHQGHFITGSWQWFASDKYEFDAYYNYDFRREQAVDQYYSIVRNFHRWAVMFTLEIDEGEDDNVSFFVRFGPRELWRAIRNN